jgi:hypothetical protein
LGARSENLVQIPHNNRKHPDGCFAYSQPDRVCGGPAARMATLLRAVDGPGEHAATGNHDKRSEVQVTFILGLLGGRKLMLYGAILAALVAAVGYLRWDAAQDAKAAVKAAQDAARIEALIEARKRRDETENLSDDELLRRLGCRIVRPDGPC